MDEHLEVIDLCYARQEKRLFQSLSFRLSPGQVLLIEGTNGSGKSSLLRLLSGLSTPDAGQILYKGKAVQSIASLYRDHLHYLSHSNGIKLGLTVMENLQLASHLALHSMAREHCESILVTWQLKAFAGTLAAQLSCGQKRRLALAKLFLLPKPLWLLDEPLTALDTQSQTLFLKSLSSHLKKGGLAVMSSHHALPLQNEDVQHLRLSAC